MPKTKPAAPQNPYAGWKTFTFANETLHFKYPADWHMTSLNHGPAPSDLSEAAQTATIFAGGTDQYNATAVITIGDGAVPVFVGNPSLSNYYTDGNQLIRTLGGRYYLTSQLENDTSAGGIGYSAQLILEKQAHANLPTNTVELVADFPAAKQAPSYNGQPTLLAVSLGIGNTHAAFPLTLAEAKAPYAPRATYFPTAERIIESLSY